MYSRVSRSISKLEKLHLNRSGPCNFHLQYQAEHSSSARAVLVIFLARRLVVGFVLELAKSASLDGFHRLLVLILVDIFFVCLLQSSCIVTFVVVLLVFLIFVWLFRGAAVVSWAGDRNALGFESFLNGWKMFDECGELLDVEGDSLELVLALAMPVASSIRRTYLLPWKHLFLFLFSLLVELANVD